VKIVLKIVFFVLMLLIGYEAAAVLKARSNTAEIFTKALEEQNIEIQLSELSKQRLAALLAVQDPKFFDHKGFDFQTPGAGVTTITQAMTKYLYFSSFTAGFDKIEQTLIAALAVTPQVSKNDQLTVFLNTAYLGHIKKQEIRGFAEAARAYYGKPFKELSEDEYLSLVAMLIAPKTFNLNEHPDKNKERVSRIKKLLSGEYQPTDNSDLYYGQDI